MAPLDRELAIEGTQNSPGVCRMLAVGGVETAFAPGCALLAELAGVAVSTKAVECQADAIGSDLVAQAQSDWRQAARRAFPPQRGASISTLYIEMDGTGIPVTATASAGCPGTDGAPKWTPEVKLGCVFTQTALDAEDRAVRDARSTTDTRAKRLRMRRRSDHASTTRRSGAACTVPAVWSCWAMAQPGFRAWCTCTSPTPSRPSTSTTPASTGWAGTCPPRPPAAAPLGAAVQSASRRRAHRALGPVPALCPTLQPL